MPGSSSASPATGHACSPSNAHAWYPGTNSPSPGPEPYGGGGMTWPVTPLETGSGVTSTMRTSGLVSSRYACPLLRRYDTQGLASPCGRCLRRHGRPARPHRCELRTRPARRSVTGDPCLIRSCGWSSRRRRANPNYDWPWDWSRLAISVQPRTLGFQFSDPAFQRVNVLVEVEYREHRYAYVPAVPLEL